MKLVQLVAIVCCFSPRAGAGDWPQFLGPQNNGTSGETGLVEKFPTNGLPILWEKNIGTGYSAPSIRDRKLVLFHRQAQEEIVESLDASTGKSLWRFSYPTRFQDPYGYNNGPRGTPLLTESNCYTFGAEGRLTCLDLASGKMVWQRDTAREFDIPEAFFGVGTSPVQDGPRLLVMIGGQTNSAMAAFDLKTGKTIWESVGEKTWTGSAMIGWPGEPPVQWRASEKQASYATPVLATIHGERLALCFTRQGLVALNSATGEEKFHRWFRARVDESVNAMSPLVVGDEILISAAYYRVGAVVLKVSPDNRGFTELWRSTALEIHWSNPIYHQGFLYAFTGRNEPDAHFRCVEFKTGKVLWDRDERWPAHSSQQPPVYGRGSLILADGKLIALGEGGRLGQFKPSPAEAVEISSWQIPQLHYPCWAAPVLSEKRLYLRSEDKLVCVDFAAHPDPKN